MSLSNLVEDIRQHLVEKFPNAIFNFRVDKWDYNIYYLVCTHPNYKSCTIYEDGIDFSSSSVTWSELVSFSNPELLSKIYEYFEL